MEAENTSEMTGVNIDTTHSEEDCSLLFSYTSEHFGTYIKRDGAGYRVDLPDGLGEFFSDYDHGVDTIALIAAHYYVEGHLAAKSVGMNWNQVAAVNTLFQQQLGAVGLDLSRRIDQLRKDLGLNVLLPEDYKSPPLREEEPDSEEDELPITQARSPQKRKYTVRSNSRNKSGVIGVNKTENSGGKVWVATFRRNGKPASKSFRLVEHGSVKAFLLACVERATQTDSLQVVDPSKMPVTVTQLRDFLGEKLWANATVDEDN